MSQARLSLVFVTSLTPQFLLRFFYVIERSSRKKNIPVVKEVMEEFSVTFENAKNLMRRRKGNSSW